MSSKVHYTILVAVLMILFPAIYAVPLPVLCTAIAVSNDGSTLFLPSTRNIATPFTIVSIAANLLVRSNATANNTKIKSSIGGKEILESDFSPSNNGSLSRNVIVSMVAFLIIFSALLLTFFYWGKCCRATRQQGTGEQTMEDSFELSSLDVITPPPTAHIRTPK